MRFNMADMLLIFTFIVPLLVACFRKFHVGKIRSGLLEIIKYIMLFISMYISFYTIREFGVIEKIISLVLVQNNDLLQKFISYPQVVVVVVFIAMTAIAYLLLNIVYIILVSLIINPLFKVINRAQKSSGDVFRKFIAIVFAIPKSIFYTFIMALIIIIVGKSGILGDSLSSEIKNSKGYELIASSSFNEKDIINEYANETKIAFESEKSQPTSASITKEETNTRNIINLYNGVTIDAGIQSNDTIDNLAVEITKNSKTDVEKAKAIYNWIGNNITYDEKKASSIDNSSYRNDSGAIPTINSRKGVCFDYACLYVAMARKVGLKVRAIAGDAYNGEIWGPHAWNEVYLESEKRWINVDPTFSKAGNYFDNSTFNETHKADSVLGEW